MGQEHLLSKIIGSRERFAAIRANIRPFLSVSSHMPKTESGPVEFGQSQSRRRYAGFLFLGGGRGTQVYRVRRKLTVSGAPDV